MTEKKLHTTNYFATFIEVADDTKATCGTPPQPKVDRKTVAELQYELLSKNPYKYTSDDIFFKVFANRIDLTEAELENARKEFFSKGQPCFRASPLTKTYGFGIHLDSEGKAALYGMESQQYQQFVENPHVKKLKAMRNSKLQK